MNTSTANPLPALPRTTHPIQSRLVIAGCSRRKRSTPVPVPALDLYEGGCIPPLRTRLGDVGQLRDRIRILSARHGLLRADAPLRPYDHVLDPATAAQLRPSVAAALASDFTATGVPTEVLVIAEPLYLILIADLFTVGSRIYWVPDIHGGWPEASTVLDTWGWP